MLNTLRDVARLPELLVDATRATMQTARRLPSLERAIIDRLGSLDRSVRDLLALLPAVAADLERVRATVEPQHERVAAIEQITRRLESHVAELQGTLALLKSDVEDAAEHLPDPDAPGPLARARDTLTGRS